MKDLPTRNVPDTVAEGLAELAREHGMSAEAFRRKLFTEAVEERGYRQLAQDPEYRAYHVAMRKSRARRAAHREQQRETNE